MQVREGRPTSMAGQVFLGDVSAGVESTQEENRQLSCFWGWFLNGGCSLVNLGVSMASLGHVGVASDVVTAIEALSIAEAVVVKPGR